MATSTPLGSEHTMSTRVQLAIFWMVFGAVLTTLLIVGAYR